MKTGLNRFLNYSGFQQSFMNHLKILFFSKVLDADTWASQISIIYCEISECLSFNDSIFCALFVNWFWIPCSHFMFSFFNFLALFLNLCRFYYFFLLYDLQISIFWIASSDYLSRFRPALILRLTYYFSFFRLLSFDFFVVSCFISFKVGKFFTYPVLILETYSLLFYVLLFLFILPCFFISFF